MDKDKMFKTLQDASKLSESLCQSSFSFFIGAGFSRNISGMPNFKELVRDKILCKFYDTLVLENEDYEEDFLMVQEFRPHNCIHCFISSYITIYNLTEQNWWENISQVTLKGGSVEKLQDGIRESRKIYIESDQPKRHIIEFFEEMLKQEEYEVKDLILLFEYSKLFKAYDLKKCLKCIEGYWDRSIGVLLRIYPH